MPADRSGRRRALLFALIALSGLLVLGAVPAKASGEHPGENHTTQKSKQKFDWGLPETHEHGTADDHAATDHAAGTDHAAADDHAATQNGASSGAHGTAGKDHATADGEHGERHSGSAEPAQKPAWRWYVVGGFAVLNLVVLLAASIAGTRGGAAHRLRTRTARRAALVDA